jgi:HK97 family phage major capsid protein
MQLRAPITMTVGASLGGSAYLPNVQVAPGVIDLVRTQPTFWDRLVKGRTKANPYVWVNKKNKQGAATFIGEGIAKPPASFELETESSNPKKVAETMKVSTELLFDVDAMYSMIENELRFEVMTAANAAVLTGVSSSTVPAGVTTLAVPYSLITIKTTNPTEADAIRAAIAQLKVFNFDSGIVAFINPVDGANMDLAKGVTGGAYMLPPFVSADGRRISNVLVIEDNNIAQGNLLIGDMSKYKISMYQDFFVNWGWENDDFTKNLVTVIGEMRFHQYFSSNHEGAFIYDTFTNIKTAITV